MVNAMLLPSKILFQVFQITNRKKLITLNWRRGWVSTFSTGQDRLVKYRDNNKRSIVGPWLEEWSSVKRIFNSLPMDRDHFTSLTTENVSLHHQKCFFFLFRSQSYDRELQRQRCKFFLQRHGHPSAFWKQKYFILLLKNAVCSLLQLWRCGCKLWSRRIGSRLM
jgi:hypothetical protein